MLSLLKNLLRSIGVLLLVSFATFCLIFGNGVGIARGILGITASEEAVQMKVVELGLDQPLLAQFGEWISGVVTGDLGRSYFTGQPVLGALSSRVPVTLTLIVLTLVLMTIISVLVGVAAARYGGWLDRVVQFLSGLGGAVPAFIVAVVLVFAFGVAIPLFPATGYVPPQQGVGAWLASVTLPVIALLVGSVASSAAQIRGAVLDALSRDYVRTLRARGIPERAVVFRHVLRNASGPGLTALSLQTIALLGGVVFVEQVFALPGIGQLANTSAQQGDVPVVMGTVLATIVIVLCVNFLSDILNVALNPKARTR
ncbi:ABC transporter permease [Rathayibacter sp. Leaf296]|uniref:ABC transporter permease n=1 Tax=Rathayibacter sp. Leaf296 TaxID=1736327 RepID=UPI000702A0E4|nr:ABC transporter permease [Rathayibacter sp. Leaf296]KQQ09681.1 ABC transporter permease [Rathayibacter sp. Leaf296]